MAGRPASGSSAGREPRWHRAEQERPVAVRPADNAGVEMLQDLRQDPRGYAEVAQRLVQAGEQTKVAHPVVQVEPGAGNGAREPSTVREGHEVILATMPHRNRDVDRIKVEPPRSHELEVVGDGPTSTLPVPLPEGHGQPIGELSGRVPLRRRR